MTGAIMDIVYAYNNAVRKQRRFAYESEELLDSMALLGSSICVAARRQSIMVCLNPVNNLLIFEGTRRKD